MSDTTDIVEDEFQDALENTDIDQKLAMVVNPRANLNDKQLKQLEKIRGKLDAATGKLKLTDEELKV
jgi:N-acetylmuramic acid 6-phosphate (MurNAc-6-P) etherase